LFQVSLNKMCIPTFNIISYFVLPRPLPRFLAGSSLPFFVDVEALLVLATVGFFA